MRISLTKSDKEYAKHHGLTHEEMRGFVEDMIKEEEMMRSFYEAEKKEQRDYKNSPQFVYPAW